MAPSTSKTPQFASTESLTPTELAVLGKRLYGKFWKYRMSKALGVERSTITRWSQGTRKVPPIASALIRTMYAKLRAQRAEEQSL